MPHPATLRRLYSFEFGPGQLSIFTPKSHGKELCLRYISTQRCPSTVPNHCVRHYLAHFDVPSLPQLYTPSSANDTKDPESQQVHIDYKIVQTKHCSR
ncbi:hypothetical protein PHMEG_00035522 [Phytophthora megakarya]|uniref:Uncharacterized protein n=1 Tax=Phytophthora megakarya TaxID=4795 RepID=A0A225UNY2_9STRA|nr:hypothetical protein PHMEG_00035522 [Phytophthora megakarya]